MEQLEGLKLRLGIVGTEQDGLLELLLEDAEAEMLDYTNRAELTAKMLPLQRELAVIYFNRMGSEGESSRSEGAISVSYITDIPDNIKARLNSYRMLKLRRMAGEVNESKV